MALIIHGSSELGAHVRSNLCYLICLGHLIKSRAFKNRIFSLKRPIFFHACATCSELPFNNSTMFLTDLKPVTIISRFKMMLVAYRGKGKRGGGQRRGGGRRNRDPFRSEAPL